MSESKWKVYRNSLVAPSRWGGVGEDERQFTSNEYTWILQTRNFQEFQIDNVHRFVKNENYLLF